MRKSENRSRYPNVVVKSFEPVKRGKKLTEIPILINHTQCIVIYVKQLISSRFVLLYVLK